MPTGYRLREDRQPLAMGGFDYGMTNVAPRLVRPRYAKTLRNVFFKDGIRSRYGWTTLTDGMGTSINFTWDNSTVDAGRLRGFISFNSGKIAVFEKMVLWDSDYTAEDFNGGGTVASVAGQDLVGCFQWASLF